MLGEASLQCWCLQVWGKLSRGGVSYLWVYIFGFQNLVFTKRAEFAGESPGKLPYNVGVSTRLGDQSIGF